MKYRIDVMTNPEKWTLSPGEDTSQGSVMVSPTANLNASDRVMKRGSALFSIWLAASPAGEGEEKRRKIDQFYGRGKLVYF